MAAIIVCPGIHGVELTESFLRQIQSSKTAIPQAAWWVIPDQIAPYGPEQVYDFVLEQQTPAFPATGPTLWIGFSAGVVGAIAAARRWQRNGGQVRGIIAVDGWGVPLGDSFPRYRLSHDRFTALSCEWLGASDGYFYAAPGVEHLELWRSPQQAQGYWRSPNSPKPLPYKPLSPKVQNLPPQTRLTAAQVITSLIVSLLSQ